MSGLVAASADDERADDASIEDELFGVGVGEAMREGDIESESEDEAAAQSSAAASRRRRVVERVALDSISAEAFLRDYSRPNKPVLIINADAVLPMHLDVAFFRAHYGEKCIPLEINSLRAKTNVPLKEFLSFENAELNKLYLRSVHLAEWFSGAAEDVELPSVLGSNFLASTPDAAWPESWRKWIEVFICHRDCDGFPFLHRDILNTHAYSMQLQGTKEFVFFAPSDARFLYPQAASRGGISQNRSAIPDWRSVDSREFPLFQFAKPIVVRVQPGEMLYIPSNWWHTARCVSEEPSVTFGGNFVDETVREAFLDAFAENRAMCSLANVGGSRMQ
ncbi:hypothetical protein M885DRAFT_514301 [Pelagophyceae sp. CCMP2097]|nr:hypothetical protein M885DRAFT_514301 [Pelagophyceae sp. CCMP2097]|eukprot:CAMPEP_0184212580 /NCGR_PEP_ID=MMETSP0976-20121227/13710_1 /TAXON_ID=483370 /ORGANISM="non described non described, Strain CCMP2097" /LENGTH=334 /DNA_ID=CAMNT_0026517303 /DNA_START=64 /DNA_END=1068 /DNA_ORIENTATION=-